jgi:adenosylcobinamide kinase / adenosylcobinamide-phosphate guanylyltransferase
MQTLNSQYLPLTVILGGARGGKSAHALQLANQGKHVLFVATAEAGDDNMASRIARHRAERPSHWSTIEEPCDLATALQPVAAKYDTIIIDCLTLWVSNVLLRHNTDERAEHILRDGADALLSLIAQRPARWIIVTNEVGFGIVPHTELGRAYRDVLGKINQQIVARASQVTLMVAGIPFSLREAY